MIGQRCCRKALAGFVLVMPGCSAPLVAETVAELSAHGGVSAAESPGSLRLSRPDATVEADRPATDLRTLAAVLSLSGGHTPVQSRRELTSHGQYNELIKGCSLRIDLARDLITITPVVRAGAALSATYRLLIREADGSGASDIRQNGDFRAELNETIILGSSVLSIAPETRLSILFSVIKDDQEICRESVSEAGLGTGE